MDGKIDCMQALKKKNISNSHNKDGAEKAKEVEVVGWSSSGCGKMAHQQ